jgi:hypothetical protein
LLPSNALALSSPTRAWLAGQTLPAGGGGSAAGSLLSSHHPEYTWACMLCRPSPELPFHFVWFLGWPTWHLALDPSSVLHLQHKLCSHLDALCLPPLHPAPPPRAHPAALFALWKWKDALTRQGRKNRPSGMSWSCLVACCGLVCHPGLASPPSFTSCRRASPPRQAPIGKGRKPRSRLYHSLSRSPCSSPSRTPCTGPSAARAYSSLSHSLHWPYHTRDCLYRRPG